ncbi:MAG TPA: phosphoglycerate kinase [Chitinophagales bacterium]|nr:phosphoglycerate kinase [Chitinophagales bacterium]
MTTIDNYNFKDKKALVRVDFNVPLDKQTFAVSDDTRITAAVKTIKKILSDGGSAILISHLGRPKGGPEDKYSLKHIVKTVSERLGVNVKFATTEEAANAANELKAGEVLLLENLRFHKEEETGDKGFAKELSKLADVYVNDAFGTAHRAHASTAVIADYFGKKEKMFGYLMEAEIINADKVVKSPAKPFTAVIGGAKVSDKILILEKLIDVADNIIIGGGMAYTFFKAQGGKIGKSLVEEDKLDHSKMLMEKATKKNVKMILPVDSIIADAFSNEASTNENPSNTIPENWIGLDIGPNAIADFSRVIKESKTVLWNGPMGVFEMEKFSKGTEAIANACASATEHNGAFTLIGGGDSVAAINKFKLADKVSYVSTGGGAMLEYFEGKTLPGIKAIAG